MTQNGVARSSTSVRIDSLDAGTDEPRGGRLKIESERIDIGQEPHFKALTDVWNISTSTWRKARVEGSRDSVKAEGPTSNTRYDHVIIAGGKA